MKSIWKFELSIALRTTISMPKDAEIIAFQTQHDKPCVWAIVETGKEFENRFFRFIGTGHNFEETPGKFIGTIQTLNGDLVWHLFEIEKES